MSVTTTRSSLASEPIEPETIACLARCCRHDQKAGFAEPCHSYIGFYASAVVEPLCVNDPADGPVDLGGRDAIEECSRIRSLHLELRERTQIEEPAFLANRPVFEGLAFKPVLPDPKHTHTAPSHRRAHTSLAAPILPSRQKRHLGRRDAHARVSVVHLGPSRAACKASASHRADPATRQSGHGDSAGWTGMDGCA